MAYVQIRRESHAAEQVIGSSSNFSTTYAYMNKLGIKFRRNKMIGNIFLDGFQSDPYGILRDVIGTVQNLALDNTKDPKIERLNINEVTSNIFLTMLTLSNKVQGKNETEFLNNTVKYAGEILNFLKSESIQNYIASERNRSEVMFPKKTRAESLVDLEGEANTDMIKEINAIVQDVQQVFKYINFGRESIRNIGQLIQAKKIIKDVEGNKLTYFDTSNFKGSPLTESVRASVRMSEDFVMRNDILYKGFGRDVYTRFKNIIRPKGELSEEEVGSLSGIVNEIQAIRALDQNDKLSDLQKFAEEKVTKETDDFTTLLKYNYRQKRVQLSDEYTNTAIPESLINKAIEQFRLYDYETQRKWLLYHHYKYGVSREPNNGSFYQLMAKDVIAKQFDPLYKKETKKWQTGLVEKEFDEDLDMIIKFKSELLDTGMKFHKKGFNDDKRSTPDIRFRKNLLTGLSEIQTREEFDKYLASLAPFEHQFVNEVINNRPEELYTSQYAKQLLSGISSSEPQADYKGVEKVISGAQLGPDMAGLDVGKKHKIPIGGTAAAGYTQSPGDKKKVQNLKLRDEYGLKEGQWTKREYQGKEWSDPYHERTIRNAQEADGTIVFGNIESPGLKLTLSTEAQKGKPRPLINPESVEDIEAWTKQNNIKILNVAGNREWTNPGIYQKAYDMLDKYFSRLKKSESKQSKDYSSASRLADKKVKIPQNLVSGEMSFGSLEQARPDVKKSLGEDPHSIDMIDAGFRTRTTRSVGEVSKYNVKPGDYIWQEGKSANGRKKTLLTKVTAIYGPEDSRWKENWNKEGWDGDGSKFMDKLKPGAKAIEFEVIRQDVNTEVKEQKETAEDVIQKIQDNQKFYEGRTEDEQFYIINGNKFKRVSNVLPDDFTGDKSKYEASRAVGNTVDKAVRNFFNNGTIEKPEGMSEKAFKSFEDGLKEVKEQIEANGEKIHANNLVVWNEGAGIAGELDLLGTKGKNGFKIYDIKTMKEYAKYDDSYKGGMTNRQKHTNQLSMYAKLLENQYGIKVRELEIIPFEVSYDKDGNIETLSKKPNIVLEYNKSVETLIGDQVKSVHKTGNESVHKNKIEFNSRTKDFEWLSNFFEAPFKSQKGLEVKTAEHYYQGLKAKYAADQAKILAAKTVLDAKREGKNITMRDDWDEIRGKSMLNVIRQKFTDPKLRQLLKDTGSAELVHTMPDYIKKSDTYWGVDKVGEGENKLGKILMSVREEIILEDTGKARTDIIETLRKLKFKNSNLYAFDPITAISIPIWNGLIETAVLGIKAGRGVKDVISRIHKDYMNEEWYKLNIHGNPAAARAFDLALSDHAQKRYMAETGKNPRIISDGERIRSKVLSITSKEGGSGVDIAAHDFPVRSMMDLIDDSLNTYLMDKKGFTPEEIINMTNQEKLEYYTGIPGRGDVKMTEERIDPLDPKSTVPVKAVLDEEQYLKKTGLSAIKIEMDETEKQTRTEKTFIKEYSELYDKFINARTRSYQFYLESEYLVRDMFIRKLSQYNLNDLADAAPEILMQTHERIQNYDPEATASLRNYIKKLMFAKVFRDKIVEEWQDDYAFNEIKLGTRALEALMDNNAKELFDNKIWTSMQSLLLHKHHIDWDKPLLQLYNDVLVNAQRDYKDETYLLNTNLTEYRGMLGLDKKTLMPLDSYLGKKTDHVIELLKKNTPDWMIKIDPESNKRAFVEPHAQDFEKLLGRSMTEDEIGEAALIANHVNQKGTPDKGLFSEKEFDKIVASTKMLMNIREVFSKYHARYSDYERRGLSYSIDIPDVFMSKEEAKHKFGLQEGGKVYELLKPSFYDHEVIDSTTGMTYLDAKTTFANTYKDAPNKSTMIKELYAHRKTAIENYRHGGKFPDEQHQRRSLKHINAQGYKSLELPDEFKTDDFWHMFAQVSRSLIRAHHLRKALPVAEFVLDKYSNKKIAKDWLERDIDYEIYGINNEEEYWNEGLKRGGEKVILAAAYTALPFNLVSAMGNITAGYYNNFRENPGDTMKGIKEVMKDRNKFLKMVRIMNNLEIATVVNDAELQSLSRRWQRFGKFAFFTMEGSERLIQTPIARAMMGEAFKDYDDMGRLLPGKVGLERKRALEIKNELMNIHGAYGQARAHYSHFLLGRAIAQFRLPWQIMAIMNTWGAERTDYLGNYRIGSIPALLQHMQIMSYNRASEATRKEKAEKYQTKLNRNPYMYVNFAKDAIMEADGQKIDMNEVPKHIRAGWKKMMAQGGFIVAGLVVKNMIQEYLQSLKDSSDPDDEKTLLAKSLSLTESWIDMAIKDATIPISIPYWYEQTSRPMPLTSLLVNTGKLLYDVGTMSRYDDSNEEHSRGELQFINGALRVLPVAGKIAIQVRTEIRRWMGTKFKEREDFKKDARLGKMIEDAITYRLFIANGPPQGENYTEEQIKAAGEYILENEYQNILEVHNKWLEAYDERQEREDEFWTSPSYETERKLLENYDENKSAMDEYMDKYERRLIREMKDKKNTEEVKK